MRIMAAMAAASAGSGDFSIPSCPFSVCDNRRDDERECGECDASLSELDITEEETSYEADDIWKGGRGSVSEQTETRSSAGSRKCVSCSAMGRSVSKYVR